MGAFADSLFSALMSWVRALVNDLWTMFSSDRTTILEFLGKHWVVIALVLLAVGLTVDELIWFVRWQPYRLWAQRLRHLTGRDSQKEDEELGPAHAAKLPNLPRDPVKPSERAAASQRMGSGDSSLSDAQLGAYPGMRYDDRAPSIDSMASRDTQRYSAIHSEGPGAAEVARRRDEIDAWNLQMQEEARQAGEAEKARLAQEKYEREMAEYRRKRAQYALDMAEYQRKKAEYDAQMAQRGLSPEPSAAQTIDTREETMPEPSQQSPRRRAARAAAKEGVSPSSDEEA